MWSQLAWFDEEFQEHDPEVQRMDRAGPPFHALRSAAHGEKQREIVGKVLPEYAKLAATGHIEISTTPYFTRSALLCDSNIAGISHPNVPLPPRFRYPDDARLQLSARATTCSTASASPRLGSGQARARSPRSLHARCRAWFRMVGHGQRRAQSDEADAVPVDGLYRPYEWRREGHSLRVIFRDHFMSDLIGFVYSKMEPSHAAADFLPPHPRKLRRHPRERPRRAGPHHLDGENAWEYYYRNGRPFLRELYRRISEDQACGPSTVSEGLRHMAPECLDHIFPGSWINANFDVWIGAEEDNEAWTQLLRARATYDVAAQVPFEQRNMAHEELLIARAATGAGGTDRARFR